MTKILISPGYGAGWSTWSNRTVKEFLLKDPTLIEMAEREATEQEVKAYVDEKHPDSHIYTGGWRDIEIVEVPAGTLFKVSEHDGYESIEYKESEDWSMA